MPRHGAPIVENLWIGEAPAWRSVGVRDRIERLAQHGSTQRQQRFCLGRRDVGQHVGAADRSNGCLNVVLDLRRRLMSACAQLECRTDSALCFS